MQLLVRCCVYHFMPVNICDGFVFGMAHNFTVNLICRMVISVYIFFKRRLSQTPAQT